MNAKLLWSIAAPYRWALLATLGLMIAQSFATLAVPWFGGRIAGFLTGQVTLSIHVLAPSLLALLFVQAVLQTMQAWLSTRTTEHILADLRRRVYSHLQSLPIGFFRERRQGDFIALLSRELDRLSDFITGTLIGLIPKILTFFGSLYLMLRIDPLLSIPIVLGIPMFVVLFRLIGRRIRPLAHKQRQAYASIIAIEDANLGILPAIKSFTREDLEASRHATSVNKLRDLTIQLTRITAAMGPGTTFIAGGAVICMIWLASGSLTAGGMTPGELVEFLLYAALLTRPVSGLADAWGQYQHAKGALAHAEDVLAVSSEPSGLLKPATIRGDIMFDDVTFAYSGRGPAVRNLTLTIPAGQSIALTGPNGAGKSTLIELLLRFHQPQSGRLLIDGVNAADMELKRLRQAISIVPQDPMLIDGTIEENILFGDPNAAPAEVERASRRAQAWDFISTLPDGLATRIGDRGVRLSGGERQRIALARALLKQPSILILDEPTAMFDPASEARFVETARDAVAGRTVILITHRPASLALVDRIIELDHGCLVDDNTKRDKARNEP